MTRRLTIIESPFAPSPQSSHEENLVYLRECLRHSWEQGELPFASHAFFPFFLNESDPAERQLGIEAGYLFWNLLPTDEPWSVEQSRPHIVFYCDLGVSPGMHAAFARVAQTRHDVTIRYIRSK